jgi:hypothetical protein
VGLRAEGAAAPERQNWCQSAVFQANNPHSTTQVPEKRAGIRYNGKSRSLLPTFAAIKIRERPCWLCARPPPDPSRPSFHYR